jgi:hypothetical protein
MLVDKLVTGRVGWAVAGALTRAAIAVGGSNHFLGVCGAAETGPRYKSGGLPLPRQSSSFVITSYLPS